MKKMGFVLAIALSAAACSRGDALDMQAGTDVTVQKKDGVTVEGKLVEVQASQVIVEDRAGVKTTVPRADIAQVKAAVAAPKVDAEAAKAAKPPVTTRLLRQERPAMRDRHRQSKLTSRQQPPRSQRPQPIPPPCSARSRCRKARSCR